MLLLFPELFITVSSFNMRPKTVGGYTTRTDVVSVRGILQNVRAGDLGIEEETLADINIPAFWTRAVLALDAYIELADGSLYKRTKNNNWKREGAFTVYVLETVVSTTDNQVPDTAVVFGVNQYD
jgi:hypothetical protein